MDAKEIKEALYDVYAICDQVEERTELCEKMDLDEGALKNVLKMNVIKFLAYLAASDGVLSWKESRFIGELMDIHMTPSILNDLIKEQNIYSVEFEEDTPLILQIFVSFDNALYESGVDLNIEMGEALFGLYKVLSKGIVEANGRTTETMDSNEKVDVQTYLGMMRNYVDDNTQRHQCDLIVNFKKDKNTNQRDDLGGVKAPAKNKGKSTSVKAPSKKK